jgi:DNA-binding transcriptional LysR family regulator
MELRHLRTFTAVAEELHFRRAAERLHVAQPAVSEQIRNLERELGVQLLERTKRSVALTPAGATLLEDARRLLRMSEDARRAVQRVQEGVTGRLRIGHPSDVMPWAMPRALRHFSTSHPGIEVALERVEPRRALTAVRDGHLDVAMVCLPAPVAGLHVTPIGVEQVTVAVADTHPMADLSAFPLPALDGGCAVVLPRETNPPFYDGIVAATRTSDMTLQLLETAGAHVELALLAVSGGRSVALLPSSVAERHALRGVRFVPLAEPAPSCAVALVTAAGDRRLHAAAFVMLAATLAQRRPRALPGGRAVSVA